VTILSHAQRYAEQGYSIFPCKPLAKRPTCEGGVSSATIDEEQITRWWTQQPTANIGLATGRTNLLVIDVDEGKKPGARQAWEELKATWNLPDTLSATTPSGGWHYFFHAEPKQTATIPAACNRLGHGLDIRCNNTYVLIAPSECLVDEGPYTGEIRPYQWENEGKMPAEAPEPFLEHLRGLADAPKAPRQLPESAPSFTPASDEEWVPYDSSRVDHEKTYLAARNYILKVEPAIQGHGGDAATYRAAAILTNDFALDEGRAMTLINEWNDQCSPPWSLAELQEKIRNSQTYASRPYGCRVWYEQPSVEQLLRPMPLVHAPMTAAAPIYDDAIMDEETPQPEPEPQPDELKNNPFWPDIKSLLDLRQPVPPRTYVVHDFLAERTLNIVYGKPGSLKSLALMHMMIMASAGIPWMGRSFARPMRCLFIDIDSGEQFIRERATAIATAHGIDLKDTPFWAMSYPREEFNLSKPDSVEKIANLIRCLRCDMVVIDTLINASGVEDENSSKMAVPMRSLRLIVENTGATLMAVHHACKGEHKGADSLRGHSSILGAIDTSFNVKRKGNTITIKNEKIRLAPVPRIACQFEWDHYENTRIMQAATFTEVEIEEQDDPEESESQPQPLGRPKKINPATLLASLPSTAKRLMHQFGATRNTIKAIMAECNAEIVKVKTDKGTEYYRVGSVEHNALLLRQKATK